MSLALQIMAGALWAVAAFFVGAYLLPRIAHLFQVGEVTRVMPREEDQPSVLQAAFRAWALRADPYVPGSLRANLSRKITMAGGLHGLTPAQFTLWALGSMVAGVSIGLLVIVATGQPGWTPVLLSTAGAALPFVWLRDQVHKRHSELLTDLPYHLDLLTLSVEAGMDFGAAVGRMVEKAKPGALREEFSAFLAEIRMGKTRGEALLSMGQRIGLDALSTFLSALIQADRLGSSLGATLRLQAEQLRNERFQRAEKLAGEAPVKMLLPLVLFIFPTVWIILGAPLLFEWIYRGGP